MARGDQIYVMREFINLEGLYEHHGIDCGDGSVIHYRKPSETIERTSITTFTLGKTVYIRNYPTSFVADVVVRRAESRLGERQYNLLFNNCEHFANWCKIGVSESKQIKDFLPLLNYIQVDTLSKPLQQALKDADKDYTPQMLNKALGDIRVVWDNIQPQYQQAIAETKAWDKVAREALKQHREDLARRAIEKKLNYQQVAKDLETQLSKLAKMTETLVENKAAWIQFHQR